MSCPSYGTADIQSRKCWYRICILKPYCTISQLAATSQLIIFIFTNISPNLKIKIYWLYYIRKVNLLLTFERLLTQMQSEDCKCLYKYMTLLSLFSCSVMSGSLRPHGLKHTRLPYPSLSPKVCSNSCPLVNQPSNHLILCRPLLLLPSIFPSIRVFSNKSALHIIWQKSWSFSFSISPSNEYSGLISFRIDWLDLLAIWGTLKSLLQHHSLKVSILWCSTSSLQSNSHIHTWLLEKPYLWLYELLSAINNTVKTLFSCFTFWWKCVFRGRSICYSS